MEVVAVAVIQGHAVVVAIHAGPKAPAKKSVQEKRTRKPCGQESHVGKKALWERKPCGQERKGYSASRGVGI